MSEFVPDTNLNWLALAACVYGNITAGRALCCLGLVGTNPKRGYKRVSELDGNSLLKMHQAGMSLRSISAKVGANIVHFKLKYQQIVKRKFRWV